MELYGVVWNCACFRGDFLERACKATSSFSAYDVEVGMQFHEKKRGWYWAVLGCCKECILNLCCAFSVCKDWAELPWYAKDWRIGRRLVEKAPVRQFQI